MASSESQQDIKKFLDNVYGEVSAVSVSIKARQKLNIYDDRNYVYGDFELASLYEILNEIKPRAGEVFYDLGSGGGKVAMFAALAFPFAKCVGVELLEDLHGLSADVLGRLKNKLNEENFVKKPDDININFICGDLLKADVSDADVIYTYSTCFDQNVMSNLAKVLEEQLKPGARVITVTKSLPSEKFKIVREGKYNVEWGQATVFFQEKI